MRHQIEQWGLFELVFHGSTQNNPFIDVTLQATFTHEETSFKINGFYDGDDTYRVRFMPNQTGIWHYTIESSLAEIGEQSGSFECIAPSPDNHGPVVIKDQDHFAYADGTKYYPFGTTAYAWNHQEPERVTQTIETLRTAPFNKMRMCLFPKSYLYNQNEPPQYPFEGEPLTHWDLEHFNPAYFRQLERCILVLQEMNIEVDLILFHEYDRWNFAHLPVEVYDRILRYLIARIGAFRNLWWSLANEYDLMRSLSMDDWDHFFQLIQAEDPYQHLRSIHNCRGFYDHAKPWVTHCSIQNSWLHQVPEWREKYQKPVVVDECCYEGNIFNGWGNITAKEMVNRFWMGFLEGGYVTHGETYLDPDDVLWWAKGGVLHGESPARIAFLREIIESAPDGLVQIVGRRNLEHFLLKKEPDYYLQYFPFSQPAFIPYHLPEGHTYQAEIIDPWEMTITPLEQTFSGSVQIPLPEGKSSQAIRLRRID